MIYNHCDGALCSNSTSFLTQTASFMYCTQTPFSDIEQMSMTHVPIEIPQLMMFLWPPGTSGAGS